MKEIGERVIPVRRNGALVGSFTASQIKHRLESGVFDGSETIMLAGGTASVTDLRSAAARRHFRFGGFIRCVLAAIVAVVLFHGQIERALDPSPSSEETAGTVLIDETMEERPSNPSR